MSPERINSLYETHRIRFSHKVSIFRIDIISNYHLPSITYRQNLENEGETDSERDEFRISSLEYLHRLTIIWSPIHSTQLDTRLKTISKNSKYHLLPCHNTKRCPTAQGDVFSVLYTLLNSNKRYHKMCSVPFHPAPLCRWFKKKLSMISPHGPHQTVPDSPLLKPTLSFSNQEDPSLSSNHYVYKIFKFRSATRLNY